MPKVLTVDKLTLKQRVFCFEYVLDFNGKRAAQVAGYSESSAVVLASKLLKNPLVIKFIDQLQRQYMQKSTLTKERIMKEVEYNALRDVIDLCDKEGIIRLDDLSKMPESIRRCIDGIKVRQHYDDNGQVAGQTFELKLTSKLGAIELAMKHFGMLAPAEHNVNVSMDWDKAYKKDADIIDTVEGQIVEAGKEQLE
jgi:phage terminase small subunit